MCVFSAAVPAGRPITVLKAESPSGPDQRVSWTRLRLAGPRLRVTRRSKGFPSHGR